MISRTIVDSVEEVSQPVAERRALARELGALRQSHPNVFFERYLEWVPRLGDRVYLAPGAALIGDVELEDDVSVWFGCVLRADLNQIRIKARTNIQDGTVIHLGDRDPTIIEEDVGVGHRAVVHGCRVGAGCLIGIQATVLDGAVIGEGSVVGAGALVTAGQLIPPRSLVLGVPGKVVRQVSDDDVAAHRDLAAKYVRLAHNYRKG